MRKKPRNGRSHLGFGTYGSGAYFDPFSNTGLFIENVIRSANLIWLTLWSGIPVELFVYFKPEENPLLPIVWALINLFLLVLFLPFWKDNLRAKFYLAAMLMATVRMLASALDRVRLPCSWTSASIPKAKTAMARTTSSSMLPLM